MNEFDPREGKSAPALALTQAEQIEFIEELNGPLYLKSRVCKPVLQRLDEALSSGGASYDELVSIEHVLPQTVEIESQWERLFPNEPQRSQWVHRLANLVFLTQRINIRASNWDFERKKKEYFSSSDGSSPFVITQDVLRTEQWTFDHLVNRQKRLLLKLADVWQLDVTDTWLLAIDWQPTQASEPLDVREGGREITDAKLIHAKRASIMAALGRRENIDLTKISGVYYWSENGSVRAVCAVSKRHAVGHLYWYGYTPKWDEFLAEGQTSFLVLGCMDRDSAYALPYKRIAEVFRGLHKTSERHWHIYLEENETGTLELPLPNQKSPISMAPYELGLNRTFLRSVT